MTPTDGLDRGIRSTIAEFIAYRDIYRCDPTAVHKGGNYAVRDIELFDNHFWVDAKTGWYDRIDYLGLAPVNWSKARNPQSHWTQLDAVAVVPLQQGDLAIRISPADGSITVVAPTEVHWYLIPASVLFEHYEARSDCAAHVPQHVADPYLINANNPLSPERLNKILRENRIAFADEVDAEKPVATCG